MYTLPQNAFRESASRCCVKFFADTSYRNMLLPVRRKLQQPQVPNYRVNFLKNNPQNRERKRRLVP
jgi:hypothetical protein